MAERRAERGSGRRPIGGDLIIPVAAIAFTLYYFTTIWDSPWEAQVNAFFVGSILLLLVAVLVVKLGREIAAGEADLRIGGLIEPRAVVPKRLALLLLAIAYVVVVPWLGFTLTTFAFLVAAMLLLSEGRRKGLALGVAALLALGGYVLFIAVFDTRFPAGPFERLMGSVF